MRHSKILRHFDNKVFERKKKITPLLIFKQLYISIHELNFIKVEVYIFGL